MDINVRKEKILAIAVLLSIILSCCKKNDYKIIQTLNFLYPITIYPTSDTIVKGDTLWITLDIADSLYDNLTNKKYYLPNYNFYTYFFVAKINDKIKNLSEQEYASEKFTVHSITGNIIKTGAFSIDFTPVYENHRYKLMGGIIPNDTGVFSIRTQNLTFGDKIPISKLDLGKDINGHQLIAGIGLINSLINEKNTHYDLFLKYCKSGNTTDLNEWKEENTTYTFVVKP